MKRGAALSTKQQKVDWLLKHEDLWRGYPRDGGSAGDWSAEGHLKCERRLLRVMQEANLISHATTVEGVVWERLINAARKQRRETVLGAGAVPTSRRAVPTPAPEFTGLRGKLFQ